MNTIKEQLQNTDIYIIDQILKGNFNDCKSVLDVGCGGGRNLTYFLQSDFDVYGIDLNEKRIEEVKQLPNVNSDNFKVGKVEEIPFDKNFDIIICNAVLHFAKSKFHFEEMLHSIWSKLALNGIMFVRLASDIGIERLVEPIGDGNYNLPDGSVRYLVNQQMLYDYSEELNAELVEKIKTTNVQNLRCMTTWVLRK